MDAQWVVGAAAAPVLAASRRSPEVATWLRWRSAWQVAHNLPPAAPMEGVLAVARSLLLRGTPTLTSERVEAALGEAGHLAPLGADGIGRGWAGAAPSVDDLLNALVQGDPRRPPPSGRTARTETAEDLIIGHLVPKVLGPWVPAYLERQLPLAAIATGDFPEQRVDAAFPYPVAGGQAAALVLEVDGPDHAEPGQLANDRERDNGVQENGGQVLRLRLWQLPSDGSPEPELRRIWRGASQPAHLVRAQQLWERPLWQDDQGRRVLEVVLVPLVVAQVQRAMLEAIGAGVLSLTAPRWRIAIHERDVPGGRLAVEDLLRRLADLRSLAGESGPLPETTVVVRSTAAWVGSPLHGLAGAAEAWPEDCRTDLLIDVRALFAADGRRQTIDDLGCPVVILRPARRGCADPQEAERLPAASAVVWQRVEVDGHPNPALVALVRDLFRKPSFRPGQVAILRRALERRTVVGVLPTGAGKSLCYQMAVLLQPGMALVVAPLVSLVEDQKRSLLDLGIDRVVSLSGLKAGERTALTQAWLVERRCLIALVTPERLQTVDFQAQMRELPQGIPLVHTLVIDEVHCVSEWGHDFRSAYLRLGETARRLFGSQLRAMGLTGTASFDVLADVAREVGDISEQDFIEADTFDRRELKILVLPMSGPGGVPPRAHTRAKFTLLREALLSEIPRRLQIEAKDLYQPDASGRYPHAGIIFCPHAKLEAKKTSPRCVGTVLQEVMSCFTEAGFEPRIDTYSGSMTAEAKLAAQQRFQANETAQLVATIGFGMGIDKANIRYVVHISCAKSVEAWYQEIGRAGRDRRDAVCATIFSDHGPGGGASGDLVDRYLAGEEGMKAPDIHFTDQDDRGTQLYFHRFNFPPLEEEKDALWQLAKALYEDRSASVVPWPFVEEGPRTGEGDREKTGRAITRLTYLGLVRDVVADYAHQQFLLTPGDFSDEAVVGRVRSFLERYKAPAYAARARELLLAVPLKEGAPPGLWVRGLSFILSFVYQEIERKRRAGLAELVRILRIGQCDPEAMNQELAYYFNSKFYRRLQEHVRGCGIAVLWAFIDEVNGNLDATRHLYGATVRLLTVAPDHVVFRLLRAWCLLSHVRFRAEEALPFLNAFADAERDLAVGQPDRGLVGSWLDRMRASIRASNPAGLATFDRWLLDYHTLWIDRRLEKQP